MKRPPMIRASGRRVLIDDRGRVGRLDRGDVAGVVGEQRPLVAERLERPLDVRGGDRLAVGPLRVRVELEGDRLLVVRDGPALGDPGRRREVLRVEVDQQVPVHRPDVVVLLVEADERVQRWRVLRPADPQDALAARRRPGPTREARPRAPRQQSRDRQSYEESTRSQLPPPPPAPRGSWRRASSRTWRPERHRRHVLAVADGDVGDRRDPERGDQLVEHLLDRERRLRALRDRLALEVDVGAEDEAGDVVELARADQVVEQRCRSGTARC